MKTLLKRLMTCLVSTTLIQAQCYAQSSSYLGVQKYSNPSGAEYTSGNQPGTLLMRVNLWGAVNRPGIHNVPVKTDLMSLVSYAGGPTQKAVLDEVTIKREIGNKRKLIRVDVDELINGVSHHHVELAPNDIIVIPEDKPLIGQDAVTVVSIVSILMSAALAAVLIDTRGNN